MSKLARAMFDHIAAAEQESQDGDIDYAQISKGIAASLKSGVQQEGKTKWDLSQQTQAAATSNEFRPVFSSDVATP